MRSTTSKSAVKCLKSEVVTSRDRRQQRDGFVRLFSGEDASELFDIDEKTQELWATLAVVVKIIRRPPGTGLTELASLTGLLESEIQFYIRTLIDIGGEIEFVTSCEVKEGRFFLHN